MTLRMENDIGLNVNRKGSALIVRIEIGHRR